MVYLSYDDDFTTTSQCNVSGLQDMYTDFDKWVIDFQACVRKRLSCFSQKTTESSQTDDTTNKQNTTEETQEPPPFLKSVKNVLSFYDLYAKGIVIIKKSKRTHESDNVRCIYNMTKSYDSKDDCCSNYDYVLLRLLNEKKDKFYIYEYIKSKL